MAVPAWIQTAQGDLIPLGPSPLLKISRNLNSVILYHADGSSTNYEYNTPDEAATAMNEFASVTDAQSIGNPEIHTITPANIQQSTLPQNITVTGINFVNSTPVLILRNYATSVALATTFNSTRSLTGVVPNTVLVGTYDVLYSDANGGTAIQKDAFLAY